MRLSDAHHRVDVTVCPWCDHKIDAASGMNFDQRPRPGDFSICIKCGGVNVFRDDGTLRRAAESEWQSQPEPLPTEIRAARAAIRAIHSRPRP